MQFYFAPMEGVTGSLYRRIHAQCFPGMDRYFIPFLEPREGKCFDGHDKRECDPEENRGIPVVPQLLTNRADRFLEGARRLADLGYGEVNLNLGCPARTVVTRGKGSGLLADLPALEALLDEIFARSPLPVSIKTRLGVDSESEFSNLLALYRRYPLTELIVHARVQRDQYVGTVRRETFRLALDGAPWPVCYNGDLRSPAACRAFQGDFPQVERVMLGRGLVANPGLVRELRTGQPLTREELRTFHDRLYAEYRALLSGDRNVLCWMKELWFYWICLFPGSEKAYKAIRKAQRKSDYEEAVERIFETCPLSVEPGYWR